MLNVVIFTVMQPKLIEKDLKILALLQENCRMTAKEIAGRIGSPVTTVFAKIKRMEKLGIIKDYKAILDARKLHKGTTAFVLVSFSYRLKGEELLSQREIVRQIAKFSEVQEVHIITGDWDILIKVREKEGIAKTLTCMVFETEKETTDITFDLRREKRISAMQKERQV